MIPGVQRLTRVHQKWARWRGAYCSLKGLGHPRDLSSPESLEKSIGVPRGVMGIPGCSGSSKDLAVPEHTGIL